MSQPKSNENKKHATAPASGSASAKSFLSLRWRVMLLVVVSVLVYANTLLNGYVLDDMAVITHNTYVAQGVAAIPDILSTPSLSGFSERPVYDTVAVNDIYRPVSLVLFAVEHQLFGNNAAVGHLVNVLLFAVAVWFLFLFIDKLFHHKKTTVALIAALLFAVHPIHTEVVANIKSSDELLCFVFAFTALLQFLRFAENGKVPFLITAALCYFLSLLSKETSIAFLLIIPVVFFWYTDTNKQCSILIAATTIITAIVYLAVRYSILAAHNANHPGLIDFTENPLVGAPSMLSRIATAMLVMGHYIRLLFIPFPLCSSYTFAAIPFVDFKNIFVWLTVAVYLTLAIVGTYRLITKRTDSYTLGILFFLFSIALFTNIAFLTGAIMAERFLFFPSVGFCLVIGSGVVQLTERFTRKHSPLLMTAPIAVVFAAITMARNAEWKDNYTLASADVQKQPQNASLWHSLGVALTTTQLDESYDKNETMQEGIRCLRKSLAIYPAQFKVQADLGNLFARMNMPDSAETHMLQALSLKPNDPVLMSALGGIYFAQQQYAKTLTICKQALEQAPANIAILNNMALCYLQLAQYDSAIYVSHQVLLQEPANEMAGNTLTAARTQLGKK